MPSDELRERLRRANTANAGPPAIPRGRQPVHTVYGGAHLFRPDLAGRMGARALSAMDEQKLDAGTLAGIVGASEEVASRVIARVREKLSTEPVEDFRIDFEDGYGIRPDSEEDEHAAAAAAAIREGQRRASLPAGIGIRIRPLGEATRDRAERTLDLLVAALGPGALPPGFVVTLPKVMNPEQPAFLAAMLARAEGRLGVPVGSIGMELMMEHPATLLDPSGRAALPAMVAAGAGRVRAVHFGAYDYTSALDVPSAAQHLRHPACDWARSAMQLQLAGSGVWLVDGATTTLPVGPHRGDRLGERELAANRAAVLDAWRTHASHVRHGLSCGFHQGWDLHPAQLVSRYAAVYTFYLQGIPAAAGRLRNFVEQAARATRVGVAFDDAATGRALLGFVQRGVACGALDADSAAKATGIPVERLGALTFDQMVAAAG